MQLVSGKQNWNFLLEVLLQNINLFYKFFSEFFSISLVKYDAFRDSPS